MNLQDARCNYKDTPPQFTPSKISLQPLPVAIQNHHIFHQTKLRSLIKSTSGTEERTTQNILFKQRRKSNRCKMQVFMSPRRTPNPTPQPSCKLTRALGLEGSSQGIIQPKMLTNLSRASPKEQWETSTCTQPFKIIRLHLQQSTRKNQQLQNINTQNSTISIIHYTTTALLNIRHVF